MGEQAGALVQALRDSMTDDALCFFLAVTAFLAFGFIGAPWVRRAADEAEAARNAGPSEWPIEEL